MDIDYSTVLNKNKIEILNFFRKDIFFRASIRQIMRRLKKKSYQRIYEAVKELEKSNILIIEKIGHSDLVSLNLTQQTISVLSFLDEQEAMSRNIPNIDKILEFKEFLDDILLVTGSYAKDKQTSKSDIDLVIITKNKTLNKQKLLENLTALFLPRIHPVVITYKDFVDMLLAKEENYGKEVFWHRLLFRNSKRYYELVKEAIENGFRG